jgi:uncharacterized protein YyaL (SSP411 family)
MVSESPESSQGAPDAKARPASGAGQGRTRQPNRLIHQTSPYLLQHAYNPVDWYPWGREAFDRASREDKPVFISIGYSACHWCHVMERESFEAEEIARILNEHFVSIKVDREERPDVDSLYMAAAELMTGSGGWPLSIFAAPDAKPFFAGTYYPPTDGLGRPGFGRLLEVLSDAWRHRRSELLESGEAVRSALAGLDETEPSPLSEDLLHQAFDSLTRGFDREYGGFGLVPKFPQAGSLLFLLHYAVRLGQSKALERVTQTLDAMAAGGLQDHLGGGFHRYATDRQWQIPHFEKMLYDQALLATVYTRTWQITGRESYAQVARQTLDYVLADMAVAGGGFASAEDADSEGREGAFYVWTPGQIKTHLQEPDAMAFMVYYGVEDRGNFEHGLSILHVSRPLEEVAGLLRRPVGQVTEALERARKTLLEARSSRIRPRRDDKVIAAWNGLVLSALAIAGEALAEDRYIVAANRAADALLSRLVHEGRLLHHVTAGRTGGPGFLDDYAFLAAGLLDLYHCTWDPRRLIAAKAITEQMIELFQDPRGGAFFFTGHDAEPLMVRSKPGFDGAIQGANSAAAMVLLRLGHLTQDRKLMAKAAAILETFAGVMTSSPTAATGLLVALDLYLGPRQEITVVGDSADPRTQDLIHTVHSRFLPRATAVLRPPGPTPGVLAEVVPFVLDQTEVDGRPAAYVCTDYACNRPAHTALELAGLLSAGRPTP